MLKRIKGAARMALIVLAMLVVLSLIQEEIVGYVALLGLSLIGAAKVMGAAESRKASAEKW